MNSNSAPTISTSFGFRDMVKGSLMCIISVFLCPNIVQIAMCFFCHARSPATPRHRCVIVHEVVNESLRKIHHYQLNKPQHYYISFIYFVNIYIRVERSLNFFLYKYKNFIKIIVVIRKQR